ncbi:NDR1/HIN1-like protein 13 [Telopea speciosissima]|uniref:NDR1/HIN1-like protein 13 n=1 Tax=Telopea speciosissima TaxID=54955 RepID=UPI001CC70298|nr:NDR1/HIN1-like protein 13 [Telopea speciosissima]
MHSDHNEFFPPSPSGQPLPAQQSVNRHERGSDLKLPQTRRTNPFTWFTGVCCAIFWVIIILAGLVVLVIYLSFKPRIPRFDVSSVTLNAASIDTYSLLNADLTLLTNFTNPNKKVSVDFNYMVLQLYYENTLIATRAIDPFSAARTETRFHAVEMISSQVALPMQVTQKLRNQLGGNGVIFHLKGSFRTRSNFGSLFHYSYWLYIDCDFVMTRPPIGVLVAHKCITKL